MTFTGIHREQLRYQPHSNIDNFVILYINLHIPFDNGYEQAVGTIYVPSEGCTVKQPDNTYDVCVDADAKCRILRHEIDSDGERYSWNGSDYDVIPASVANSIMYDWDANLTNVLFNVKSYGIVESTVNPKEGVFFNNVLLEDNITKYTADNGKEHAYLYIPLPFNREARITIMNPDSQIIRGKDKNGKVVPKTAAINGKEKVDVYFPRRDWTAWIYEHNFDGKFKKTSKKETVEYVANVRHRMQDEYNFLCRTNFTDGLHVLYSDAKPLDYYAHDLADDAYIDTRYTSHNSKRDVLLDATLGVVTPKSDDDKSKNTGDKGD